MQEAVFCFTVDDVGMPGYSSEKHLDNVLQFCADENIMATFFVVPRPHGQLFHRNTEYVKVLNEAKKAGHAIAQHGLEHGRFDLGIPPKMVLDLPHEGPARAHFAEHRQEIERSLTIDNIRARLREGRDILEEAFGFEVDGFRAPCLAVCDNLFMALDAEGYRYDSSGFLQKAAWDLINGESNPPIHPITRDIFDSHQAAKKTQCFPLTAEYTWYLTRDRFNNFLELAKHDFDACLNANIPFVQLSHVSPIQEGDADCGFALYRELLAHAKHSAAKQGKRLVSTTLAEATRIWTADTTSTSSHRTTKTAPSN
jgi:predicted deacetylase